MRRQYRTISEIFGESFHVMKSNWMTYVVAVIVMGIIGGTVSAISFLTQGNAAVNFLVSLVNLIVSSAMAIIYIGTVCNTLHPENASSLGEWVSENLWQVLLTQILLIIIVFVPAVIFLFVLMTAIFSSGAFGLIMFMMMVFAILMIILALRMAFLVQGIVLSQKSYWQAIKWSWNKTSGHIGMIIGIGLVPALVTGVVFTLMRMEIMTLTLIIIFGILSAIVGIIAALAFTVLYIDVVEPEYLDQGPLQIFEDQF